MEWIIENSYQTPLRFPDNDDAGANADPGQIEQEMDDDKRERFLLELGIATNEGGQQRQVITWYL